jgi:hypothetical protein
MNQAPASRRRRETVVVIALTLLFGGGTFLFFLLITGWLLISVLTAVVVMAVMFGFHYLLWGRQFTRATAVRARAPKIQNHWTDDREQQFRSGE